MSRARALAAALALACALGPPAARAASPEDAAPAAPASLPAREFACDDLARAQRLAIAALQDLGFAIESADAALGVVSASRLDAHALRLTVTLSASDGATVTASVATDYAGLPLADPRAAEAFFRAFAAQLSPPSALD
jgi:hypothetical protein